MTAMLASGAKETLLLAHDWGVMIAWQFASHRVRPLDCLVIFNGPPPGTGERTGRMTLRQLKRFFYVIFFQLPGLPERVLAARDYQAIEGMFRGRMAGRPERFSNEDIRIYKEAMARLGVDRGDRIATIAWNNYRHFELYFAISGMGAVCHTINPRLFHEQIVYVINHAEDKYVFMDLTFVPLLEALGAHLPKVAGYVIMTDKENMPETKLENAYCYSS